MRFLPVLIVVKCRDGKGWKKGLIWGNRVVWEEQQQIPLGNDRKKGKGKGKDRNNCEWEGRRVWKKLGTEYCVFRKKKELFSPAVVPVVGGKVEMYLETAWMAGLRWG